MAYVDPTVACSPWTDATKLCNTGSGDSIDCDAVVTPLVFKWMVDDVISAATNLLFRRTCYRYPGVCTRIVIPCICHQLSCVCGKNEPTITLTSDYPILSIVSVTVDDGAGPYILDPGNYRLDEHARLIRTDGLRWPTCWTDVIVSYETGRMPPMELQMAAAELADELLKACGGGKCDLPPHVRSVSRRGIEHEVWDVVSLMAAGMTGLPLVDHALMVHGGPCRKTSMFDPTRSHPSIRQG